MLFNLYEEVIILLNQNGHSSADIVSIVATFNISDDDGNNDMLPMRVKIEDFRNMALKAWHHQQVPAAIGLKIIGADWWINFPYLEDGPLPTYNRMPEVPQITYIPNSPEDKELMQAVGGYRAVSMEEARKAESKAIIKLAES